METTNVMMKFILTTIVFLALAVSGVAQTRNVIVNTNGVIQSPTNFWSADVTNARSGLGLGTAATNPASAFQPSSVSLSNLAAGNGGSLTNITATIVGTNIAISNIVGLQGALDGKLATNGNTTGTASNVTGVVSLANGGTGGTDAASARTSLGATTVGASIFTLSNPDEIRFLRLNANSSVSALTAADFRTAIGASATVGTVTSVGMTVPSFLSVSPSTITSSGTFALTLANQTSRQVLIAPTGGGVPTFRGVESDDLPSLAISKITGLQTALDGKLATGGTAILATNVTGIVALANGGTGGSNAATGRTGLGATTVGASIFTLINPSAITFLRLNADNTVSTLSDANFRTAIGLGTAATNPATAFQPSSSVLTNLAAGNGGALTNLQATNIIGTIAISNGGSGATTAGGARTNLGLGATNDVEFSRVTINQPDASGNSLVVTNASGSAVSIFDNIEADELDASQGAFGNTVVITSSGISFNTNTAAATTRTNLGGTTVGNAVFTATNAAAAATAIDLGVTNNVIFSNVQINSFPTGGSTGFLGHNSRNLRLLGTNVTTSVPAFYGWDGFASTAMSAGLTRTNLDLGWSALTNTNTSGFNTSLYGSGTNPVLYNTNGEVVSPTNFWQVAPIVARFVESQPVASQTTNITAARNLHIHSLAISTTGVTNTIALPTTNSFNGDIALVVHQGPTSSVTAVRTAGAATNLVTLNQFEEAVEFVYYNNVWQFNHNRSFVEPIFFSGTNAAANAAASRTNLGGTTVGNALFTAVTTNSARTALGASIVGGNIFTVPEQYQELFLRINADNTVSSLTPAATRTNLGLGQTNSVTFSALTLSSDLTLGSGDNIVLSTTNGTKIGTATNQLLGFYNQTPVAQPSTTGVTTNGFTGGGGGNTVHAQSTFTGGIGTNAYTIGDIVAHLKSLGLIAE